MAAVLWPAVAGAVGTPPAQAPGSYHEGGHSRGLPAERLPDASSQPGLHEATFGDRGRSVWDELAWKEAAELAQRAVHLLEYVAVDYPATVEGDRVVNELEYQEQLDFLAAVAAQLARLGVDANDPMYGALERLRGAVEKRAPASDVTARARALGAAIRTRFGIVALPPRTPSIEAGRALYKESCVACHGETGKGDGPLAGEMDPPPADLTDRERMLSMSPAAIYATLTFGIDGTAMPSYADAYDAAERYDLAFYVGSLAFDKAEAERGRMMLQRDSSLLARYVAGISALVTEPASSLATDRDAMALIAAARLNPALLEQSSVSLEVARKRLEESWRVYLSGEPTRAGELAIAAYLEGFEPLEARIDAVDPNLRRQVEEAFLAYRRAIHGEEVGADVVAARAKLLARLGEVEQQLSQTGLAPVAAFVASLTILAREGFEAVLIVVALVTLVMRSGRGFALRYLHAGWVAALLAGIATWVAAQKLIAISGAQRELVEAVSSLLAAAILFYVSYWLLARVSSVRWQAFLRERVEAAMSRGSLWGLFAVAFVAVYREMFETILFYQALFSQAGVAGGRPILAGAAAGALLLFALAVLALRLGKRMPVRRFFVASSFLLYALAIVLAGQGAAALQEIGWIPTTPVPFVRIEWLGIYPRLETLAVQAGFIVAALIAWGLIRRRNRVPAPIPSRDAAAEQCASQGRGRRSLAATPPRH